MKSKYNVYYKHDNDEWWLKSPLVDIGPFKTREPADAIMIAAQAEEEAFVSSERIKDYPQDSLDKMKELGVSFNVEDYTHEEEDTAIVSDGGSSRYYTFSTKAKHNLVPVNVEMEVENIIKDMVGNDFDLGNIVKASRRIYLTYGGGGKAGTTSLYDWKKILYTAQKNINWLEGRDEERNR